MVDLILSLTDEQFAATAAGLTNDPAKPKSDEERVTAYYQTQVDSVASQFVKNATEKRLASKGLPAKLAEAGLKPDELAALEAYADGKPK